MNKPKVLPWLAAGCLLLAACSGSGPDLAPSTEPSTASPDTEGMEPDAGKPSPAMATRDEAGATASAVAYDSIGQDLLNAAPSDIAGLVDGYLSPGTADVQIDELSAQLRAIRDRLDGGYGPIRYLSAPLAVRIEDYSADRARVSVWSVGVLWRAGAASPQAGWATTTYVLVWEDDAWLVESREVESGPTPAPNAGLPTADPGVFSSQLDGFQPWP